MDGKCVIQRLEVKGVIYGWIILEEKKSLMRYSSDDFQYLDDIAKIMASILYKYYQLDSAKRVTSELIHEIRNTTIGLELMIASLANRTDLDPEEVVLMDEAMLEVYKLGSFCKKYLSLEGVERLQLNDVSCISLAQLVKEASIQCREGMKEKGVELKTLFDPDMVVFGDWTYLCVVLSNIIGNAVKYLDKSIDIEVRAYKEDGFSVLQIIDYGPGFSTSNHCLLKSWLDGSGRYVTSGFGLPMSQKLVALHGGTLTVLGKDGEGTTVEIRLPEFEKLMIEDRK